jgi:cytidylate kinase
MPAADRPFVLAIDGPSGAGKSTVARAVARRLGLRYLDTGAMYRAVTLAALERGVRLEDAGALVALAAELDIEFRTDPAHPTVRVDGRDVTGAVREAAVSAAVSTVSAVPGVREQMVRRQQAAIGAGDIVVEGRDIGTTVAPYAAVKIFLTASLDTRSARRAVQQPDPDTADDVARRDQLDSSRAASPLAKAADAQEIDTTHLSVADVVQAIVTQARPLLSGTGGP